jgi:phosphotransferase system enzyme I (PtsI)
MANGICASKGYAIGRVFVYRNDLVQSFAENTDDVGRETERLEEAVQQAKAQIEALACDARDKIGAKEAEILNSQINFLNDPEFVGKAYQKIQAENASAERAVSETVNELNETFSQFDDDIYIKERAADIKDIGARLIRNLTGTGQADLKNIPAGSVIVAHELRPSDTAQIDKSKVLGFVTETGGLTSHTAIMARAMRIAAIVGYRDILLKAKTGDTIIVDGFACEVFIHPEEAKVADYEKRKSEYELHQKALREVIGKDIITSSGQRLLIAANIGEAADADAALKNGADAIGLFRTEFLYMDRDTMPSEEEMFKAFAEVAKKMGDKPVVIRTLDIGGDKTLPYLDMPKELNPFLGLRAIRFCLRNRDIFKIQLRALLKASASGNVQIMFPMIGSLCELAEAKAVLEECKKELVQEQIDFNRNIKVGMMIEIPAAAIMADEFAKHVDFFSIGTNDLTQYTLAVDRMNEDICDLYDCMDPAVLRLIKNTIDSAHKSGIKCCMCGEMAANTDAIPTLLAYGLYEYSVSAGAIPEVKDFLLKTLTNA